MSRYDHLDRESLIRLLQRRDAERQLDLQDRLQGAGPFNVAAMRFGGDPGPA